MKYKQPTDQEKNCHIRVRHKKSNNNIKMLEIEGRQQTLKYLEYVYKNANIFLDRKLNWLIIL